MAISFAERMAALNKAKTPAVDPSTSVSQAVDEPIPSTQATPSVPAPKRVFGANLGSPIPTPTAPTVEEKKEEPKAVVEDYQVGNIILLANEANKILPKEKTEGEALVEGELPEDAIIIKQKIANLADFDGISLRYEMDELKKLIKASPDACMFLLPEELGLTVRALRKMTGNKVAQDMGSTKSTKKAATVQLTAAEIAAAMDDL